MRGEVPFLQGMPTSRDVPFEGLQSWIDHSLPPESPAAFGMHPSADLGYRAEHSDSLVKTLLYLQPRHAKVCMCCCIV